MPVREEVTVGGKSYRLKESLLNREYASLSFTEDYIYLAGKIVEIGNSDMVPKERREKIAPYWNDICALFFEDVTGLSFDEIDGVDMGALNSFFGQCAASMIRVPESLSATSTDTLTAPGQ